MSAVQPHVQPDASRHNEPAQALETPPLPPLFHAFDDAQRHSLQILAEVVEQLRPGVSEADVARMCEERAQAHGFTAWFHAPEVSFGGRGGPLHRPSSKKVLSQGTLVEIDVAPANEQAFGDAALTLAWGVETEPELVSEARELCRATCGFASRWKCTGELFVFARAWANNRRKSLGEAKAVGHACLPPSGMVATGWPRSARLAILLPRHKVAFLNARRMSGIYAIEPRLVDGEVGARFEEMVYIDADHKRILGRSGIGDIGTLRS